MRHQPFPLNGVKKYLTGCCIVCSKIHCLYCWNIFVFCAGKHPCQDCVQVPWVSLWPAQQTWSRCTCRWKAEGGWRENHLGIIRLAYSYDLGLLGYFVCQHFQHMKKIKPEIFLAVLCSLVVVFPFWNMSMCKSCNPSLPWCQFLCCALCSLSTEFLGNSKRGLYFHCKVRACTIFLEAMFKLF